MPHPTDPAYSSARGAAAQSAVLDVANEIDRGDDEIRRASDLARADALRLEKLGMRYAAAEAYERAADVLDRLPAYHYLRTGDGSSSISAPALRERAKKLRGGR